MMPLSLPKKAEASSYTATRELISAKASSGRMCTPTKKKSGTTVCGGGGGGGGREGGGGRAHKDFCQMLLVLSVK